MANVNIGKVALTPAGDYNSTSTYEKLDIVKDQGSSFIAKKAVPVGTTTGNDEYWQMVASIGATGPTGPEGPIGHTIEWGEIEGNIEDQEDLYTSLSTLNNTKENLIIKSASGSIVSFDDSADYSLADLKIDINPIQDLHGYDNPWPAGGGKNKLPLPTSGTVNGIALTTNADGSLTIKGTAVGNAYFDCFSGNFDSTSFTGYKFRADSTVTTSDVTFRISSSDRVSIQSLAIGSSHTATIEDNGTNLYFALRITNGTALPSDGITIKPMLYASTETDTSFAPYSNICPISGHTSAIVKRTGKNLFNPNAVESGYFYTDGSIRTSSVWVHEYIRINGGDTYTISGCNENAGTFHCWFDKNKTFISRFSAHANGTYTAPNNAMFMGINAIIMSNNDHDIDTLQIELSSSASSYEPYQAQQVTIDLNGTRYGGELNVLTGEMTVTKAIVDLGALSWGLNSSQGFMASPNIANNIKHPSASNIMINDALCSALVVDTAYHIYYGNYGIGVHSNGDVRVRYANMSTNPATFKSDVTGWTFVYPLATPFTVTLSPSQISTLLGTNNIWADTGDINVKYWTLPSKDITTALDNKLNEVIHEQQQLITNIEPDMKASNNYVIGDLVIIKNKLLRVTQNVSSGSSFVIDSNVVVTTIEDELASTYTKTETDNLLNTKANSSSVYTKTEMNTLLNAKADTSSVYTKTETDTLLDEKLDTAPTTEMTGDIVMFDAPVDNAIKALSVEIEPVQDLHGYDNPWPAGGGKNLWNIQAYEGLGYNAAVDTIVSLTESTATVTGNNISYAISAWGGRTFRTKVLTAGTYHFHVDVSAVTSIRMTIYQVDSTDNTVKNKTNYTSGTVIDSNQAVEDGYYLIVYIGSNTAQTISVTNYQIESRNAFTAWSPWENICPISGHDTATVTRTGKNLLGGNVTTQNNDRYKVFGSTLISNTPDGTLFLKAGKYTFSTSISVNLISCRDKNAQTLFTYYSVSSATFTLTEDMPIKLIVDKSGADWDSMYFQLELSSSASAFEAPQIQQVTIDLDGTRYGGVLNVLTGAMTVTWTKILAKNFTWTQSSQQNTRYTMNVSERTKGSGCGLICSHMKTATGFPGPSTTSIFVNSGSQLVANYAGMTSITDWNNFITDTNMEICYEIETPLTVQLTPNQMSTLLGQNNIWADTGDVALTLRTGAGRMAYQDVVDYDKLTNKPDLNDKATVITETKSGSIIGISDGSKTPVSELSISIEPVQAGTDDPSPENVRPITGWTSATVTRTGKNLCPMTDWETGQYASNGWEVDSSRKTSPYISIKPNTVYTMSIDQNATADLAWINFNYFDADKNRLGSRVENGDASFNGQRTKTFTIHNTNARYVRLTARAYSNTNKNIQNQDITTGTPQLELSSVPSSYEPYQAQQVTIDLDGTIYGGTLNVLTGQMTVDKVSLTFDGSEDENWFYSPASRQFASILASLKINYNNSGAIPPMIGNIAKPVEQSATYAAVTYSALSADANNKNALRYLYAGVTDTLTLAEFKLWLGENNLQICYELAEPFTIQLTPSQLSTFLGQNYIWADTGDIEVTYRADSKLYIDQKINEAMQKTKQIIAAVTNTMIAPNNLTAGNFIIVGDNLLKVTSNISSGETLSIGTNCVKTTVAEALIALASA